MFVERRPQLYHTPDSDSKYGSRPIPKKFREECERAGIPKDQIAAWYHLQTYGCLPGRNQESVSNILGTRAKIDKDAKEQNT